MSEPYVPKEMDSLDPVQEREDEPASARWTWRLVLFLRAMAVVSLLKGLYHWARVTGISLDDGQPFELHSIAWQTATVFFAVIDLVAAVGLWLAAAWGAVIWLMAVCSMLAVEMFFPQVFGAALWIGLIEGGLLAAYLVLALKAAQEQPQ
jgi:fatty acid desaturase